MKKLIGAMLALALSITPAFALSQFYDVKSGQWSIEGFTGEKNFCSAKTYWDNNSYVSMFIMKGENKINLYVHNTEWAINGDYGKYYTGDLVFRGSAGVTSGEVNFELKDPQTIIVRDVTDKFLNDWIVYREMVIVMPNDIPDMIVGLSGTAASTEAIVECLDILNSN